MAEVVANEVAGAESAAGQGNGPSPAPARKRVPSAEKLASMVVEQLKEGTAPWIHPVKAGIVGDRAMNPKTGAEYHGVNQLLLSMMQPDGDPRWCTIHQANDLGAKVRKGSRGVPIRALVGWETEEGEKLDKKQPPPPGARPLFRVYSVFHASQLDGIEPHEPKEAGELEWKPVEKAEELLQKSGATILHDQAKRCFYRRTEDAIHLPPREHFVDAERYYSTALHELGHWTGHESRLNRDMGGGFGSEKYAREELRAELASYMLALELGIGHDPGSHASYIDSWVEALEKNPLEIYRASEDASRIVDYVMGRELELGQDRAKAQDGQDLAEAALGVPPRAGAGETPGLEFEAKGMPDEWIVKVGAERLGEIRPIKAPGELRTEFVAVEPAGQWLAGLKYEASGSQEELMKRLQFHFERGERERVALAAERESKTVQREDYELPDGGVFGLKFKDGNEPGVLEVMIGDLVAGKVEKGAEGWAFESSGLGSDLGIPHTLEAGTELKLKNRLQAEYAKNALYGKRVNLDVAYEDREKARGRGARWDAERKTWYAILSNQTINNLAPWLQGAVKVGPAEGARVARETEGVEDGGRAEEQGGPDKPAPVLGKGRRVDLDVPYPERKEAKALGAKWDRSEKTWYVVLGQNAALGDLERWEKGRPTAARPSPVEEFRALCESAGLVVEGDPVMDGEIHRVPVKGGKSGALDGAYVGHLDGHPAGYVRNWREGEELPWRYSGEGHAIKRHEAERQEVRDRAKAREAEREAKQFEKAKEVRSYLETLPKAGIDHPYLVSHGAAVEQDAYERAGGNPYGALQDEKGNLVIPLRDRGGDVWSLARIGEKGWKQFEKGGAISGRYHVIGRESDLGKGPILLTTGFGTGAAIAAATKRPVICAMSDANLPKVAEALRNQYMQPFLILADDDRHKEVNSGRVKAEKALDAVDVGRIAYPAWTAKERDNKDFSDFADVAKARGLAAVRRQVECEVTKANELWREGRDEVVRQRLGRSATMAEARQGRDKAEKGRGGR